MAKLLTPKVLVRGFEIFALASLVGFGLTLWYGNNLGAFVDGLRRVHWGWLVVGLGLASMDWIGGGLRLWVVARQLMPKPSLKGMILAGGMSAWAAYITPLQSGAFPMMMYTMRRYGIPLPVAATCALMGFVGTVGFFAIAGPLALLAGAGKALGTQGDVLGLSLYQLFLGSLTVFAGLGVLLILVMIFPRLVRNLLDRLASWAGRRSERIARRVDGIRRGIDEAHGHLLKLNSPRGWLSVFLCIVLSGPSHANKLLAGYATLRALGIHVNFVDVLLLQTFIAFLLYFAPTPGASGIAEVMSAAVMSVYVPKPLTPLYTLLWRLILSWYTVGFGFVVFARWVRKGLQSIGVHSHGDSPDPAQAATSP
jgi:uncharacterized protein (TIRG00374 family)